MAQQVIQIPTINDAPGDFTRLFSLLNKVKNNYRNVRFDFSQCDFMRPNSVAFLGGLARWIQFQGGTVEFDWKTLPTSGLAIKNLCQNGFADAFNYSFPGSDGNSIPYREDKKLEMNSIMDYLTYSWIGKGWVHVSKRLQDAIAGRMWEIYNNAFEHSGTSIGVFSCGQYFPEINELILTVIDFGQGIPEKIRRFAKKDPRAQTLPANACLKWAFQRGTTTCIAGVARGLGLDLLKEFIRLNQGKLEVYSNEGYALIDKDGEKYKNRDISFEGTVIHITLCCDEHLYRFSDESPTYLNKER